MSGLLEHIGAVEAVNPLELIRKIPNGMKIDGLRDRIVKIISDYNLQVPHNIGLPPSLLFTLADLGVMA